MPPFALAKRAIPLALTLALLPAAAANAAVFDVDSGADTPDAAAGDSACRDGGGSCTLRAAIDEANGSPGDDAIRLPAGRYVLHGASDDDLNAAGDLDVANAGSLTIAGTAPERADVVIDGNGALDAEAGHDRVFHALGGASLTVRGVTVTGGYVETGDGGGGFRVEDGASLELVDTAVRHNVASIGWGGGVSTLEGTLRITGSAIDANHAGGGGGGIGVLAHLWAPDATPPVLDLSDSSVDGNSAGWSGGGVANFGGTAGLARVTVNGNSSRDSNGGGIANLRGTLAVTDGDVSDNDSSGSGGGLHNEATASLTRVGVNRNRADEGGGAIYTLALEEPDGEDPDVIATAQGSAAGLTLENSTVGENNGDADGGGDLGGGIHVASGQAVVGNSTVARNRLPAGGGAGLHVAAGAGAHVFNSVLAENRAKAAPDDCSGPVESGGHNVESASDCGFTAAGDVQHADVRLAELASNGGLGDTFALLPGSAALDAADDSASPATDARGVARPYGAHSDAGAFEYRPAEVPPEPATPTAVGEPVERAVLVPVAIAQAPRDETGPNITLSVPRHLSLRRLLAGFRVRARCDERCSFTFRLFASAPTGTLHSAGYNFRLANTGLPSGSGSRLKRIRPCVKGSSGSERTAVCKRRIAAALGAKPGRTFKVKLIAAARDAAGNRRFTKAFVTVHR